MRLLFLGDVVGRPGRKAVTDRLPGLRERWRLDCVVVNGENAAGGFGITEAICDEILGAGADAVTLGNHTFDQREALVFIARQPKLIRPANYPPGTPGRGATIVETRGGARVLVVNVMGRVFLDGRASLVVGTHTHVPTGDHRILPGGTAYLSDAGMCGDYDSVLGMQKDEPLRRFLQKTPGARLEAAQGEGTLCGIAVETDAAGLALRVAAVRLGPHLEETWPRDWD